MSLTPLPGDPAFVQKQAAGMLTAADRMERAAARLRSLMEHDDYRSEAVDAVKQNADELAGVMTKASVRYRGTGDALHVYAGVLDAAQQQARRAIEQLGGTDVGQARSHVMSAETDEAVVRLDPLASGEDHRRTEIASRAARDDLARQEASARAAHASYEDARLDVEHAATIAASSIHHSVVASDLNDSFWDDFEAFKDAYLVPVLEAVVTVLTEVNKVLGVLALVLAFVPGLQGLAAALKTLSLALTLITFVATVALTVLGERTFGELLTASLVLAASTIKLKGAAKPGAAAPKPGPGTEGNLAQSSAHMFAAIKDGHPDWKAGGQAVLGRGLDEAVDLATHALLPAQVADFLVDPQNWAAQQAGQAYDKVVPADQQVSTNDLAASDVDPLASELHHVDAGAIVENAFAARPHQPPVLCSVAGGGGGGW